jgi:hypothetical protein
MERLNTTGQLHVNMIPGELPGAGISYYLITDGEGDTRRSTGIGLG